MRSAIHSASFHSSEMRANMHLSVLVLDPGNQLLVRVRALRLGSFEITTSAASRIHAPERKIRVERELRRGRTVRARELPVGSPAG